MPDALLSAPTIDETALLSAPTIDETALIYRAMTEKPPSIDEFLMFAHVLGWHQTGLIKAAGGIDRFEAGFRSAAEETPTGVIFPADGSIGVAYRMVLEADAMGLLPH